MSFELPLLLALGALVIILALVLSPYMKDALSLRIPLGPPGGVPFAPPLKIGFLITALRFLEFGGVFLLFAAAAGPFSLSARQVWLNRGADIIFVLDVSPSMAALDMGNRSRFNAARHLVYAFAANRPSDAAGLVAVGKSAALLLPPTVDRGAFFDRLESLRLGELGDGTALGMGLGAAALHIKDSQAPRRIVVLITDGENNAGAVHPETAAEVLAGLGASLWVIGVGSGGEALIDYEDPVTGSRRVGTFDSRFDHESLRAVARAGGGVYIPALSADAFALAFSRIDEKEITVGRAGTITKTIDRKAPFLIAGALLILAARCIRRRVLGSFL
ncbi:MAG: VWA domain-containing protein [Spirochaetaceae bacterium]|nr:VWA domain-containing protein [Spirochaetaceae bacterium]